MGFYYLMQIKIDWLTDCCTDGSSVRRGVSPCRRELRVGSITDGARVRAASDRRDGDRRHQGAARVPRGRHAGRSTHLVRRQRRDTPDRRLSDRLHTGRLVSPHHP